MQRKDSHGSSDDPLPTARKQKRRDGAKLKFEQQRNARNEEKTQAESNKVIVEEDVNSGRHIELCKKIICYLQRCTLLFKQCGQTWHYYEISNYESEENLSFLQRYFSAIFPKSKDV